MSLVVAQIGTGPLIAIAGLITALIIAVLVYRSVHLNRYRQEVVELQGRITALKSLPIESDLGKAEAIVENMPEEKALYESYKVQFQEMQTNIEETIDPLMSTIDEALFNNKIKGVAAQIEDLTQKVDTAEVNGQYLHEQVKEITEIENNQRVEIIRVKDKYRKLQTEYQTVRYKIESYAPDILKVFSHIEEDFIKLERLMNTKYYNEADEFTQEMDARVDQLASDVKNLPSYIGVVRHLMPNKIKDIDSLISSLSDDVYAMNELNVEKRHQEIEQELVESADLVKAIKIDEAGAHLEKMTDHIEALVEDLTKERESYLKFRDQWRRCTHLLERVHDEYKDAMVDYNHLQTLYVIDDKDVTISATYQEFRDTIDEYEMIQKKLSSGEFSYAKTFDNVNSLIERLNSHEEAIKDFIAQRDTFYMQERRAADELENINIVLLEIKSEIKNHHLPMISETYKDYIQDSYEKAREIEGISGVRPIKLKELSAKVDGARDIIYKLYDNVHHLVVTAEMVEEAIVFGNRYRSSFLEVNTELTKAEVLFRNGEYTKALATAIDIIERIKPGSYEALIERQETRHQESA